MLKTNKNVLYIEYRDLDYTDLLTTDIKHINDTMFEIGLDPDDYITKKSKISAIVNSNKIKIKIEWRY